MAQGGITPAEEREEAQRFEVAGYPALRTQCDCIFGEDYFFRYDPVTIQTGKERYSFAYYENKTMPPNKSYAAECEKCPVYSAARGKNRKNLNLGRYRIHLSEGLRL